MKRVTALVGSGHQGGHTLAVTRMFLDKLEAYGDVEVEMVNLGECNLGVCRGCKACFKGGEEFCPHRDDRDILIGKMMSSDGVVFASPNYSFQVSAVMKIFLDRLGFVCHRPRFFGKTFTSIVVQGIYGGDKIVKYLDFFAYSVGFRVVKGRHCTALEPMTEKARRKIDGAMAKLAGRFREGMAKPACPSPSFLEIMIFRMSRTSINRMLDDKSRDYTYFREKGWFDSDFYYPARMGSFKKAVGTFFDWLGKRMYRKQEAPTGDATAGEKGG